MNNVEIGTLLTLLLAIISGTYFIGKFDGRLSAVEADKDYSSFIKQKDEALEQLNQVHTNTMNEIEINGKKTIELVENMHKQIENLRGSYETKN